MPSDLHLLTAIDMLRHFETGELTPTDVMEACLARIDKREDVVCAFAHLDRDRARAAAGSARPGPLHGVPLGVKDVLDTADMPSQYGSPIWRGWRPKADSAPVAWARAAGAVVVGKTVTTEFATRKPGPTTNPANRLHTPGGSSSGSAAGVAAGFFPVAFGTQTAGSIIRPAAYCGVVGYKPSFGTINRNGMKIMSDSLDTVGVIARTVADCALVGSALSGIDLGNPDIKPDRPPRVGVCRSPTWAEALAETRELLPHVAEILGQAGAHVSAHELPNDFAHLIEAHPIVMNAESGRALGWELATDPDGISKGLLERLHSGLSQTPAALASAYDVFARTQRAFSDAMGDRDILITPSAPGQAPKGLEWTGDPAFNFIWTSLHVPCITVPVGAGPDGLPLGIQIVGRKGQDRAVLAWAQWVQAAMS